MSRTNETRQIEWHETCKCKFRLNDIACNDKGACDKGFIWNPSNCECKYYKSCDFSEYLNYKNCKH